MITIGTRGSKLALWQAHNLQDQLKEIGVESTLKIIKTKGDNIQHLGFDKIEGKGFFTKEIEDELLAGSIDVAVHSLKDLPTQSPEGLSTSGLSTRANPVDLLIYSKSAYDNERRLGPKKGAKIGTSSIRRKVQLHDIDDRLDIVDIRGNVPTRINKIAEGIVDGIVIAAAGVNRLDIDLSAYKVLAFQPTEFVPAPAQGVIGYQCRTQDKLTRSIISKIHQSDVAKCTNVERKILKLMNGGCQMPLGAYCHKDNNGHYHCSAILGSEIGAPIKRVYYSQSTPQGLAEIVFEKLND